ncbi:MAG: hypothetical protein H0U95_11940 [Bacteroidetes bacterium]|nr:hypothetical protein [Bacteroidota bacterium]
MTKDFTQVMSERTDKQLVDILTLKRDEYQPEAIFAAEKEIEHRQINVETFYSEVQIHEIQNSTQIDKADMEFEWYHKILTIFLPATIIAVVTYLFNLLGQGPILKALGFPIMILIHYAIHNRLKDTGYIKMAKDFLKWVNYTLYIYIGLILVAGLSIYFFFM